MGLWGASQAIAFAAGGVIGTAAVDLMRLLLGSPLAAYAFVFALEGVAFFWAARLAARVGQTDARESAPQLLPPPRLAAESTTR